MPDIPAATRDKLLKIKALAERGQDHERMIAARKLEKALADLGLTLADLLSEEKDIHYFKCETPEEAQLLLQIVAMITDAKDRIDVYRQKGSRKKEQGYALTPAQYAEVSDLYGQYRAAWKAGLSDLMTAFIQRNKIFPPTASEKRASLSEAELAEALRIVALSRNLKPAEIRKQGLLRLKAG